METNIIHRSSGMSVNVRFCPEMSVFVRQSFILWVCFRWRRYHICTPLVKFFRDYFWVFFRKIPLMYSKWSLCFLVANIQCWKCEVKCFGKFFMKENKSYLVQYVSTKNIILRFMLGSQVCGPQVCEPIVIHWILIIYHYKKVIFNTKTSMKKIVSHAEQISRKIVQSAKQIEEILLQKFEMFEEELEKVAETWRRFSISRRHIFILRRRKYFSRRRN